MEKKVEFWRNDSFLIPFKIISIYVIWKIFHHFATMKGTSLNVSWEAFCFDLGTVYAFITSKILSFFGQQAYSEGITIYLGQQRQIWVQDHCLAIPAKIIFMGSIVSFIGEWREKLMFIAIGMIGIVTINILRLIFITLAWEYFPLYFFDMNHSLIYVIICYGFIFLMIRWWMLRHI